MKLTATGLKKIIGEELKRARLGKRRLRESAGGGGKTVRAIKDVMSERVNVAGDERDDAWGVEGDPDSKWGNDPAGWADWVISYVERFADEAGFSAWEFVPWVAEKMSGGWNSDVPGLTEMVSEYWNAVAQGSEHPVDDIPDEIIEMFTMPESGAQGEEVESDPMTAPQVADAVGDFSY